MTIILDCLNLGLGYLKSLYARHRPPQVVIFFVIFLLTIFVKVAVARGRHRRLNPIVSWTLLRWQPRTLFCSSLQIGLSLLLQVCSFGLLSDATKLSHFLFLRVDLPRWLAEGHWTRLRLLYEWLRGWLVEHTSWAKHSRRFKLPLGCRFIVRLEGCEPRLAINTLISLWDDMLVLLPGRHKAWVVGLCKVSWLGDHSLHWGRLFLLDDAHFVSELFCLFHVALCLVDAFL